jgi:hypothetical protein
MLKKFSPALIILSLLFPIMGYAHNHYYAEHGWHHSHQVGYWERPYYRHHDYYRPYMRNPLPGFYCNNNSCRIVL